MIGISYLTLYNFLLSDIILHDVICVMLYDVILNHSLHYVLITCHKCNNHIVYHKLLLHII